MRLKQLQLFKLEDSNYNVESLIPKLESLSFIPCPPSMPHSMGWVTPIDVADEPLTRKINHHLVICLQIEEKILPATVVRQELQTKIKELEVTEGRKVRQKEKLYLKDEIIFSLLPRAFSKLERIYAYIDTKNNWLVLGTTNQKKTEQFLSIFKKSVSDAIHNFELKKLAPAITYWLTHQNYPDSFAIEKTCVLQDAQQQNRVIRCQQQDLFAQSIQALIKDGCEVKQLALSWHDQVDFILTEQFTLQRIRLRDELQEQTKELEAETVQQVFDTEFFMLAETLSSLLEELLQVFSKEPEKVPA